MSYRTSNKTGASMGGSIIYTRQKKEDTRLKSCKKCKYYNLKTSYCYKFKMAISSTENAKYCKEYLQVRKQLPKGSKYNYKYKQYK